MTDPKAPDAAQPITISAEAKKLEGPGKEFADSGPTESMTSRFGAKSREFFEKMTDGGKKIAGKLYEGLNKIPGVNMLVAKMEVAYNQTLLDMHEKKAVKAKGKMDCFDVQCNGLDKNKERMEAAIAKLNQLGMPGADSLRLQMQKIDQQKTKLLDKKDKHQSKFEARENKTKLYAEKRDVIADKLIGRYDDKLVPMEKELERLHSFRDEVDLEIAGVEVRHKRASEELKVEEDEKNELVNILRETGQEAMIPKLIKPLEIKLAKRREEIRLEKEKIQKRKIAIDKKIAKADEKANPHRDKREKFIRVKASRPLEMNVETRKKSENRDYSETTKVGANTRAQGESPEEPEEIIANPQAKVEVEREADRERLDLDTCVLSWNNYLQKKYKKNAASELINLGDFQKTCGFSGDFKLDLEEFKNLLGKYLKRKKMPMDKFKESADDFVKKTKPKK